MARPLNIALPKGRMSDAALDLFRRAGLETPAEDEGSRKLRIPSTGGSFVFMMVKPQDVPIYVEYGTADLGIAGRDAVLESGADVVDALDLAFGECRMALAGPTSGAADAIERHPFFRLATKYPRIAERHFADRGLPVEIIALSGSVELACSSGLADAIVDLVESGRTLKENDLAMREVLFVSTARLIVNRASHKLEWPRIRDLTGRLKGAIRDPDPRG